MEKKLSHDPLQEVNSISVYLYISIFLYICVKEKKKIKYDHCTLLVQLKRVRATEKEN